MACFLVIACRLPGFAVPYPFAEPLIHPDPVHAGQTEANFQGGAVNKPGGEAPDRKRKTGFSVGYGFQQGLDVAYHHEVLFLEMMVAHPIKPGTGSWMFELMLMPQFNLTRFRPKDAEPLLSRGYEFGLNLGARAMKHFDGGGLSAYAGFGVGPHYVSGVPERQSAGFLFSDNVFVGLAIPLSDKWQLDLKGNFRHISNASLKRPNGGINNLAVLAGLVFLLPATTP
ncbi:MAG: acyloxyacyl hydrolase [Bacteroidales bacterium]